MTRRFQGLLSCQLSQRRFFGLNLACHRLNPKWRASTMIDVARLQLGPTYV